MIKSEHMDNFKFHFIGHQMDNLEPALSLACARHGKIIGWHKDQDWLVFYWSITSDWNVASEPSPIIPFPAILSTSSLIGFIKEWLSTAPMNEEPNIDGSVSKGYEILSDNQGCDVYESFRIRSIWAMHHK